MRQAPRSPLSFKLQRVANVPEHPPPSTRLMSCAHIANRQLSRIIGASSIRKYCVQIDRRTAHKLIGGALLGLGWITSSTGQDSGPPLPNPTTFQSGDLVWPKKPGAFVPYKYALNTSTERDAASW